MTRRLGILVAFGLLVVGFRLNELQADAEFLSYAFGKVYTTTIGRDALRKTPAWRDSDDNPPVSARKAIRLADAKRKQLVSDTKDFEWRRVAASLVFDEYEPRSYWRISYEAHIKQGGESGVPDHLDLYILMDGTLVEPIVERVEDAIQR